MVNPSVSEVTPAVPEALSPEELLDNFELLEDWDARYASLVELGEALPPMMEDQRTEQNKVQGCMSQVWVCPHGTAGVDGRLHYQGDCDTSIIKGVLAVLIGLYSGRTAEEIAALDTEGLFDRLGLKEHLSPNRHFGIYAIVEKMKAQAGLPADH